MKDVLHDIVIAGGEAKLTSSLELTKGGVVLEAEEANFTNGKIGRDGKEHTGSGYVEFSKSEDASSITWMFDAPEDGLYTMEVRYAQKEGHCECLTYFFSDTFCPILG